MAPEFSIQPMTSGSRFGLSPLIFISISPIDPRGPMGNYVRSISETDVDIVIDIYKNCYGDDYPYKDFYSPAWIKKGVFADEIHWLVVETDDGVEGSGAVMLEAGDHDDLMGEFGRLVVKPGIQGKGIGAALVEALDKEATKYIEFGFGEARTTHLGSQTILGRFGFQPIGFEPMKYHLAFRESFIFYAKLYGHAQKLRNHRPLIVPEVEPLASLATRLMELETDLQVDTYAGRYPVGDNLRSESIDEMHLPRLLRIEMGRVQSPEIFGSLHLNYGFFKIKEKQAQYLVAHNTKDNDKLVGAIGFTIDDIDNKAKIFELVAVDDFVKGFLIDEMDKLLVSKGLSYIETDVSAYSPRIQKTFLSLGYHPIVYAPAMVFQDIERLDIVRFAKVVGKLELQEVNIVDDEGAAQVYETVMKAFQE